MTIIRSNKFKIRNNFVTWIGDEVKVDDVASEIIFRVAGWAKINPSQESKS